MKELIEKRLTELDTQIEEEKGKRKGLTRELMDLMERRDNLQDHLDGKVDWKY